jgi:hypothetical protein
MVTPGAASMRRSPAAMTVWPSVSSYLTNMPAICVPCSTK